MPERVGQELLDVPLPDMVSQLASGVASAQRALDQESVETSKTLSEETVEIIPQITRTIAQDGSVSYETADPVELSLLQVGLEPTFYEFEEATIDVEMDIKTTTQTETDVAVQTEAKAGWGLYSASVKASAEHNRKFGREVHGTSHLTTKMVPVPAPENLMPDVETVDNRQDDSDN